MDDRTPTTDELRASWDAIAGFWDDQMEAGNTWQRSLIQPAMERLLELRAGERVLEIACGNGEFARRMAELGASVLATDFSKGMLERARARGGEIEYRLADATDEAELRALGEAASFDVVVCNMALMDMASIEPFASVSARLLRRSGRLVFSVSHPAFNGGQVVQTIERAFVDGELNTMYSVKVSSYGRPSTNKGVAIPGQPASQWYFDRPIVELFRPFFAQGFALDGLEEPLRDPEAESRESPSFVYTEIPGVLVARMRPSES